MIERYWRYNPKTNSYKTSEEEPLSVFPTVVKVRKNEQLVFCRLHHTWERIAAFRENVLKTSCGKLYAGPFVRENSVVNYGYDVQKRNETYYIEVKSQTSGPQKRRLLKNHFELNLEKHVLYHDGEAIFKTDEIPCGLCPEITQKILDELAEKHKAEYKIKPTVSSSLKGFSLIIGYMLSPFNVNFYKIAQHWGLNPYDKDFISLSSGNSPTAENEMFESLGIKPTKQIRKLYQKFPQSIVCYAAAKDLGFTDVNILQKSATPKFYVFLKYYMITFRGSDVNYAVREGLKSFAQDLIPLSDQETVWASIERTLGELINKSVSNYVVEDGINSYLHARTFLTEKEKKDVMHEGFNQYTHDFLVRRLNNLAKEERLRRFEKQKADANKPFPIEQAFLDLEYKCGEDYRVVKNANGETERIKAEDEERFCFYVARDAKELKIVGSEMHNCVGWGYAHSVRERNATIVYAKFRGKYRICIEVTPSFTIRQSLGPSNQPLEGESLKAYHEWSVEKHIRFEKAFSVHLAL